MPLWGVEMKLDTFAVPFTADRRMAYAAAYLEQCSYRQVEEVQAADFVLLPVPAKDYMLEGLDGHSTAAGCWCVAMGESVGYSPGCCWPTVPM